MNKYQLLLDRCTGPAPRPYVKAKPLSGIDKHERELDSIEYEYQDVFAKKEK